jgi:hypothetical protein
MPRPGWVLVATEGAEPLGVVVHIRWPPSVIDHDSGVWARAGPPHPETAHNFAGVS